MNKAHIWEIWRCEAKTVKWGNFLMFTKEIVITWFTRANVSSRRQRQNLFFILCQRQIFVFILFFPSRGSENDVITFYNFRLKIVEKTPFLAWPRMFVSISSQGFARNPINYIFLERQRAGAPVGTLWEKSNNIFNLKPTWEVPKIELFIFWAH